MRPLMSALVLSCLTSTILVTGGYAQGNIFLTGHDMLYHQGQMGYDKVVLDYLRDGSELPATYTIGVIGSGGGYFGFSSFVTGYPSATYYSTVDLDSDPALQTAALQNDVVIILSHSSCGGCGLTSAGSAIINSQMTAQIHDRFNAGMDLWVNSGATHPTYYDFLPPELVTSAVAISGSAFCATPAGVSIGIAPAHTTGHATHNRFSAFSSALTVAETDCPAVGVYVISLFGKNIVIPGRTAYGVGCGGALPLMQDAALPIIGSTLLLTVSNIPAGSRGGVELIGLVLNPGIDLGSLGMPGCFLLTNQQLASVSFSPTRSTAAVSLPLPNDPALAGVVLAAQAATITPGINQLGVVTSNGVSLRLGF